MGQYTLTTISAALYHALKAYPTSGKGIVIGSLTPWAEGFALRYGAEKIITAEYNPIISEDERIVPTHPMDIAKNWKKWVNSLDFAISFSSLEHSGLGRYGDILDPIGDLREVQKTRCLLKPGSLFYLDVPTGRDVLAFNANRVYGWARWPLMAAGFQVLGIFKADRTERVSFVDFVPETYLDTILVLRKV